MPDTRPSIRFHLKTKGNQEFVLSHVEISNGIKTVPWQVEEARGHETMRAFCIALLFTKFRSEYDLIPRWYEIIEPRGGKNWAKTFSENLDNNKRDSNAKWWSGGQDWYRGLDQDLKSVCETAGFPFEAHEHGRKEGFKITYKIRNRDGDSCWAIWRLKFFDENEKEIQGIRLLRVAREFELGQSQWVKKKYKWKPTMPSDRVVRQWRKRRKLVPNVEEVPMRVQAFVKSRIYTSARDKLTSQITAALRSSGANRPRAILHGISGIGKTQTALQYVHDCIKNKRQYTIIWWIRCNLPETMAMDYAALALKLGVVEDGTPQQATIRALTGHLAARHDWLLIFDSATNDKTIQGFFPEGQGHIIITSQDDSWDEGTVVSIPIWTKKIAAAFVLARTGRRPSEGPAAARIASAVHFHPLSLEQIASYLNAPEFKRTHLSLEVFLSDTLQRGMRSQPDGLLRKLQNYAPHEHAEGIATTFDLAFGRLMPAAAELIRLCSFFAPNKISSQILVAGTKHLPQNLQSIVNDPMAWTALLGLCRSYSLILQSTAQTFSMHGLVQLVARCKLSDDARKEYAERAIRVLLSAFAIFPENNRNESKSKKGQRDHDEPLQWDDIFPHFVEACKIIGEYGYQFNDMSSGVVRLFPYLYSRVDPNQISAPTDRVFPDTKIFHGMFNRIALKAEKEAPLKGALENTNLPWRESNHIRLALAFNLFFRGDIDGAEKEFNLIIDKCKEKKTISQDYPGIISLPMLATIKNYKGEFERGHQTAKDTLKITGGLENDPDPDFIQPAGQALWALAEATMRVQNFKDQKECKLGLRYLNKSFAMIETWYPQARAFCLAALGLVHAHLGDLSEANRKCTQARNEEMIDPFARGVAYFYSGEVSRMIARKEEKPDFTETLTHYNRAYNIFNLDDELSTEDPDATEYLFYRARCKFQIAATHFEQDQNPEKLVSKEQTELALREAASYGAYRDYWIRDSSAEFAKFVKSLMAGTNGFDASI